MYTQSTQYNWNTALWTSGVVIGFCRVMTDLSVSKFCINQKTCELYIDSWTASSSFFIVWSRWNANTKLRTNAWYLDKIRNIENLESNTSSKYENLFDRYWIILQSIWKFFYCDWFAWFQTLEIMFAWRRNVTYTLDTPAESRHSWHQCICSERALAVAEINVSVNFRWCVTKVTDARILFKTLFDFLFHVHNLNTNLLLLTFQHSC